MRATSCLSLGSPSHLGRMMAFSDCSFTWSGFVSTMITLDRSRFKYDRSLTGVPSTYLVASRKSGHMMMRYGSSLRMTGSAMTIGVVVKMTSS